ncbi:MAG TPA: VWA domain-containing protein [Thermoanaerobaculaceae bacterium]|nr:VWA domain-containing protein [Thermoanaerobaculaceae bacterium]
MTISPAGRTTKAGRRTAPAAIALLVAAGSAPATPPPQPIHVHEAIEVPRVLVDARVVDSRGTAVPSLGINDFRVLVDGKAVTLESVEWVEGARPFAEGLPPEQAASAGTPAAPPGRLIVFFFQTDFASVRLNGLMTMKARAIMMLDTLLPTDRVAVVSFDSHLRFRQDFTSDRELIAAAVHRSILFGGEERLRPSPFPSLIPSFDAAAARRAASPETGLLVVGRALEKLPGAKSVVYFGWGLGHLAGGPVMRQVMMGHDYAPARAALARARASVFAIDVTDADYHDLEVGLERVAEDTGGFYAKTNLFPGQAITRIEGALAGHYVLVVVRPDGPHGSHEISVEVSDPRLTVLARPSYDD